MALHWNMEEVEAFDEIKEGFEWDITEAMIFGTMTIGINEITAENADEVFVRLRMAEAVTGAPFWGPKEDGGRKSISWSHEMVTRRIGLRTNASTMTKAKFNGMITRRLRQAAETEVRVAA